MANVYEPAEDSKLLLKHTLNFINSNTKSICEVGIGSGFVISSIAKENSKIQFFGTDINPDAISMTKAELENTHCKFELKETNLLDDVNEKFDILIFNTPYFPFEDKKDSFETLSMKDRAIYGGKVGYETTVDFIHQIYSHLNENGVCLIIISSLTNPQYIEDTLKKNLFDYETLEEGNSFFEKILCIKITKNDILKRINEHNVTDIKYLASGKHSIVLDGKYHNSNVIIKVGKFQHLQKEALFEEKLQDLDFVPKMLFKDENFVIREKIDGELINDYIANVESKEELETVLDKILEATQKLDEMGINKFEMTNPYKHIYVLDNHDIKFIDFERCIFTTNPKNTTQVLEFFRRNIPNLEKKGIKLNETKILQISKKYKTENFVFKIKDLE